MEQLTGLRFPLKLSAQGPQQIGSDEHEPWEAAGRAWAREAGPGSGGGPWRGHAGEVPVALRGSLLEGVPGGLNKNGPCVGLPSPHLGWANIT